MNIFKVHVLAFFMKKIVLFIDGNNFYYGLKSIYGDDKHLTNFNFNKLGQILAGKNREFLRAFYYNASLDFSDDQKKYWKQQRFFDKIRNTDKVKLVLVRLQKRKEKGTTKHYYVVKGDDIHIAVDMVKGTYENTFDIAILVSGDGDFVPAVKVVQEKGKSVENAYFPKSLSWHLKQECDSSIQLTKEILDKCFD